MSAYLQSWQIMAAELYCHSEEELFVAQGVAAVNLSRDNPELYRTMSQTAVEVSRQYDWSVIKDKWLQVLRKAIR
jgi:glycosyltransferase involved in cell wall biosynthesis